MSAFELGVLAALKQDSDTIKEVAEFGLKTCQLCCWDVAHYTDELAELTRSRLNDSGVHLAALWAGWSGPSVWDFIDGPATLGIVPEQTRQMRVGELKKGADFAAMIGAPAIITHLGFIPEDPRDPVYPDVVNTVVDVAGYCKDKGIGFWFESGQETPVALLRLIEDVAAPNLGINFDTANVVLYGKANPLDALDVFGKYVRNLHAKDGLYPTNGRKLGDEVPIGQGKADFTRIFSRLKQLGFDGQVIIEREISGPQQQADIRDAVTYLSGLIGDILK